MTDHETDKHSQLWWPDHILDSHRMKTHIAQVDFGGKSGNMYKRLRERVPYDPEILGNLCIKDVQCGLFGK